MAFAQRQGLETKGGREARLTPSCPPPRAKSPRRRSGETEGPPLPEPRPRPAGATGVLGIQKGLGLKMRIESGGRGGGEQLKSGWWRLVPPAFPRGYRRRRAACALRGPSPRRCPRSCSSASLQGQGWKEESATGDARDRRRGKGTPGRGGTRRCAAGWSSGSWKREAWPT